MKTANKRRENAGLRFIALVPHRDACRLLEEYRRCLFAAGFLGAFSLPPIAPLALVSRPFSKDELKQAARAVRDASMARGGKISAAGTGDAGFETEKPSALLPPFYSLLLDLPQTCGVFSGNPKVLFQFSKPALFAAARAEGDPVQGGFPKPPELSFRAAMIVNLSLRALEEPCSFEWKMSPPAWLPNVRAEKRERGKQP